MACEGRFAGARRPAQQQRPPGGQRHVHGEHNFGPIDIDRAIAPVARHYLSLSGHAHSDERGILGIKFFFVIHWRMVVVASINLM